MPARVAQFVLSTRWVLATVGTVVVLVVETSEHGLAEALRGNTHFWREVLIFAGLFPGILGASLSLLLRARRDSDKLIVQAAGEERDRFVRELHDGVAQKAGYLRMRLDELAGDPKLLAQQPVSAQLQQLSNLADQLYADVRSTLLDLHALANPRLPLRDQLEARAQIVADRAGFALRVSSQGMAREVSVPVQEHLLHILDEALTNVERHANARTVHIRLHWNHDALHLEIADDGRGFRPGIIGDGGHLGLSIMQQRAAAIEGHFNVQSSPARGTRVSLLVQLPGEEATHVAA